MAGKQQTVIQVNRRGFILGDLESDTDENVAIQAIMDSKLRSSISKIDQLEGQVITHIFFYCKISKELSS
jgi:hypothetical protein